MTSTRCVCRRSSARCGRCGQNSRSSRPAELPPPGDPAAQRDRVFRALVELLSSLDPAVVMVEDLYWADEQTLEVSASTTADPPARLAMVLTLHPEEVEPSVPPAITRRPGTARGAELGLERLDRGQTGVLGAAIRGMDDGSLGIAPAPDVPRSEHKRSLARALETVPSIGDPEREVFRLGVIAVSLAYVGDRQWRRLAEEIVARTGGTPRSRREADAYLRIAMAACHIGAHGHAEPLVAAVIERADRCEDPQTAQELACTAALLDFCRGRWAGLRDRAESLCEELELLDRLDVEVVAACLALAAGDSGEARRRLTAVAHVLETTGDRTLLAFVAAAVARQAIVSGEVASAVDIADRFLLGLEASGHWAPVTRALPAIIHLFVATGQEARARSLVARVAEELTELDAPLAPAALAHARGFLDRTKGLAPQAAQHFLTAAGEYERLACPYEAAQASEQAGAALVTFDMEAGERELRAALAAYQALGASSDHARCARVAREHGVRLAATHRRGRKGYGDALSPRELEVARLATDGLSNKAIAAELYLSPNTVAKHLGRAMRKLGVRSRAAIATRLGPRHLGDPDAHPTATAPVSRAALRTAHLEASRSR